MGDDVVTDTVRSYLLQFSEPHRNNNMEEFRHNFTTQIPSTQFFPERDDSWSIIWYIASFSGLIAFFLIVSCSEWCCRLHVRSPSMSGNTRQSSSASVGTQAQNTSVQIQEMPPPAYDLFAPPSYESLAKACSASHSGSQEKTEYDVYVVPVHAISMLQQHSETTASSQDNKDEPPSYTSVQMNNSTR